MLREASHGTDDFYRDRAAITKRLIAEKDFTAVTPGLERHEAFSAQQNARLVRNAEEYHRTMFKGRVSSWNLRDSHMVQTLHALDGHLGAGGAPPRIAVWAHNSHLGDASATEMGERGEWNVGQLVRERHTEDAVLVGFSTHRGWVTVASDWHAPPQRKRRRDGLPGSWEDVFRTHRRHQRRGAAGRGPGVERRRRARDVSVRYLVIKELR